MAGLTRYEPFSLLTQLQKVKNILKIKLRKTVINGLSGLLELSTVVLACRIPQIPKVSPQKPNMVCWN